MSRTALASLLLLSATTTASADRRLFTSTYEYKTVPAGATAIELWHTQSLTTWDADDPGSATALENIVEIEHGLTDHWDAALYMVFTQLASHDAMLPSQPYAFHELKLETRYRFADRGELPIDILAYAEVAKEFGEGVYEVEGKGIFARDFDRFTAAFNAIAEVEFGPDVPETELELGWAAGITYEVHPKLNIGVETYGSLEFEDETEVLATVGPAIAVAPSSDLWFALTTGVGLDEAPKFTGRLILGIEL